VRARRKVWRKSGHWSHPTFFSRPLKPGACSLARRCGAGIQPSRIQPGWRLCNRSHRRRVPYEQKKQCSKFNSVDLHQPLGNLRWSNWIIWLAPEPFPKAIMRDERIRTLGDSWQHAIGNVIAGPACSRRADPVVDRRRHYRVHRLEGRRMVFPHGVAVYAEPRAQGQPGKELISCLSPRVV
jgi:hypothetical protein